MEDNDQLINKYILKLNDTISDLTKKNLVLEVQLDLKNEELSHKGEEIAAALLKQEAELSARFDASSVASGAEFDAEIQQIKGQRAQLQDDLNAMRTRYQELVSKNETLVAELHLLREQLASASPSKKKTKRLGGATF